MKMIMLAAAVALCATPALAKSKRVCMKDGAEVEGVANKKECKEKGGKWKRHHEKKEGAASHAEKAEEKPADAEKPAEGK